MSVNVAGVSVPVVALTLKRPEIVFAVKSVEVATPVAPVTAVVVAVPLANVPEAPAVGALKVTVTPATGLPSRFVTIADRVEVKAIATVADCGEPAETAMLAAGGVFVSENAAAVAEPVDALTV